MAYAGYLLKIGSYIIPKKFFKPQSYSPYVNMQDVEDYTDANGYLHLWCYVTLVLFIISVDCVYKS